MVWTFMGNTRMYQALRDYGDRISQVGLFSFKVRATGEIYESGVSIADGSNMRTYIKKWPHIKWLLTVANDGTPDEASGIVSITDGILTLGTEGVVKSGSSISGLIRYVTLR